MPRSWPITSSLWIDLENFDADHDKKNSRVDINEIDLLDRFLPVIYNEGDMSHPDSSLDHLERDKRLSDASASSPTGQNSQGLWLMPGRRR
jgi:hypothetical protein